MVCDISKTISNLHSAAAGRENSALFTLNERQRSERMLYPMLTENRERRKAQTAFRGLNLNLNATEEEFVSMTNMGSDEAPMMAPRKRRRKIIEIPGAKTLLGGGTLSWIRDGKLYYGGAEVADGIEHGDQLVRMGAYLIVWPDKIVYNTHTRELSRMDFRWEGNGVHVRPCMISGQTLSYEAGDEAPAEPADGMYWYNTGIGGLYQYLHGAWVGIDTVYSRLECMNIGKGLKEYDVVQISGMDDEDFNMDAATVYARGDDYIVIATGMLVDFYNDGDVVISREAPELDRIVENGNRLWGYSNKTHEVRSCKLGDPWNWSSYLGISTDSYAATVGSQGDFTGIYNFMGYVHFFKENRIHRLYGTQPSNFQLIELQMRGVKQGCEDSLCVVNEQLYYMSRDGIIRYDGSGPICVSEPLGKGKLESVICGAHGNKLYVSAITEEGPQLYALDTMYNLWHREDETRASAFAATGDGDYILDSTGTVWGIDGAGSMLEDYDAGLEDAISWEAVTGDMLTEYNAGQRATQAKRLKKMEIRLQMDQGSEISVDIQYNSDGRWNRTMTYQSELKKTVTLPLMARSCDHFSIRYQGKGRVIVYAVTKIFEYLEGTRPYLGMRE